MKLSRKHFDYFRRECEKQLVRLGLQSWKVYFEFGGTEKDAFATTRWKYSNRVATIFLATDFPEPFDCVWRQLRETALHECLEILLAPVSDCATDRGFVQVDFDKEVHVVIRTLEKLLTKDGER